MLHAQIRKGQKWYIPTQPVISAWGLSETQNYVEIVEICKGIRLLDGHNTALKTTKIDENAQLRMSKWRTIG